MAKIMIMIILVNIEIALFDTITDIIYWTFWKYIFFNSEFYWTLNIIQL